MCLLDTCCCCFSLTTGMHLICFWYIGMFSFIALNDMKPLTKTFGDINWISWYVYGGLLAGICGWIGLRWEKKAFVVILFFYDVCLALARAGLIYMHYTHPRNMNIIDDDNDAHTQLALLGWQLYFMWVQYSYLRKDVVPDPTFYPLPQNVIVSEVCPGPMSGTAPSASEYPNEYRPQLPHVMHSIYAPSLSLASPAVYGPTTASISQPVYPPNYPHLYSSGNYPAPVNSMMSANMQVQPFPYDAPPPYSESKQMASAPPL